MEKQQSALKIQKLQHHRVPTKIPAQMQMGKLDLKGHMAVLDQIG